jgi:hypothetical protein
MTTKGRRQRQLQIPPLRCGMTKQRGDGDGKGKYWDSGFARMISEEEVGVSYTLAVSSKL